MPVSLTREMLKDVLFKVANNIGQTVGNFVGSATLLPATVTMSQFLIYRGLMLFVSISGFLPSQE
jgi:hypothetical protein